MQSRYASARRHPPTNAENCRADRKNTSIALRALVPFNAL